MSQSIHRVLVSRTDRLGDVILSTPVATALKAHLPEIHITFLARDYTSEALRLCPHVDAILKLEDYGDPLRVRELADDLRRQRYDAVIALFPRPALAFAFRLAGIPIRIGSGYRWYSFLFNQRVYEHRKKARRHEAEHNLQLLQPLGIASSSVNFDYSFEESARTGVLRLLQEFEVSERYVVLHPGSGGSARDWPPEYFARIADYLATEHAAHVVLTGTSSDQAVIQAVRSRATSKLIDLSDRLTIAELAALLQGALLFIGNSSGPLHLAVMVGANVIAFYPPIRACRPERWGPYGHNRDVIMSQQEECFRCRKSGERYCECMRAISPATVIKKIDEKLHQYRMKMESE